MNIVFLYQSIEIDTEKSCDFDLYLNDFPIVIDDDFYRLLSITIDSYRLLSILLIDKVFFSVTSVSIGFRYQSILISGLNRLISIITIHVRYRFYYIRTEKYTPKSYVVNFHTQIGSSPSKEWTVVYTREKNDTSNKIANDVFSRVRKILRPIRGQRGMWVSSQNSRLL